MLIAAFASLALAVVLGTLLALLYLRAGAGAAAPWPLAAAHGLLGVGGFALLLLALQGPPRGAQYGTAAFGTISATLIGIAALIGGTVMLVHLRKRRRAGTLIGLHATVAISGFVVLAAYILV